MPDDSGNPTYSDFVTVLQQWMQTTGQNTADSPFERTWAIPTDFNGDLTTDDIYDYYDSSDVNNSYATEYGTVYGTNGNSGTFTGNPVAYLQTESDGIDTLAKHYVYRYQPRLKNYRDDCENKTIRTYSALSLSLARLAMLEQFV